MYNKEKNYVVEVNDGIYLMKSRFLEGYHFTKEIKKLIDTTDKEKLKLQQYVVAVKLELILSLMRWSNDTIQIKLH